MASSYDIKIDQGAEFRMTLTLYEGRSIANWNGWSGSAQIRDNKSTTGSLIAEMDVTISENGQDVILFLGASVSATLPRSTLHYDVLMTTDDPNDDRGIRLIEGKVSVSPQVST